MGQAASRWQQVQCMIYYRSGILRDKTRHRCTVPCELGILWLFYCCVFKPDTAHAVLWHKPNVLETRPSRTTIVPTTHTPTRVSHHPCDRTRRQAQRRSVTRFMLHSRTTKFAVCGPGARVLACVVLCCVVLCRAWCASSCATPAMVGSDKEAPSAAVSMVRQNCIIPSNGTERSFVWFS